MIGKNLLILFDSIVRVGYRSIGIVIDLIISFLSLSIIDIVTRQLVLYGVVFEFRVYYIDDMYHWFL